MISECLKLGIHIQKNTASTVVILPISISVIKLLIDAKRRFHKIR